MDGMTLKKFYELTRGKLDSTERPKESVGNFDRARIVERLERIEKLRREECARD
jgi:hypothetical protein